MAGFVRVVAVFSRSPPLPLPTPRALATLSFSTSFLASPSLPLPPPVDHWPEINSFIDYETVVGGRKGGGG